MIPHPYRDAIPPVETGDRPRWSVMIPTYNCAKYLPQALKSVLDQAPGPEEMQIEVVDDHSNKDDPEAVVRNIGKGRVEFFRQSSNTGVTKNLTTCLQRAKGRLVHLLHGDDYVADGFYSRIQFAFDREPSIGFAFCRHTFVHEGSGMCDLSPLEQEQAGILDNYLARLASEQRIMTPSIVVKRKAYERLGGFDHRLRCAEDWEMWIRIAAESPVWYEPEPLAFYRIHSTSNTGRNIQSGDDMEYTRQAINLFRDYLTKDIADEVNRRARETYAFSSLDMAYAMFRERDFKAVQSQIHVAFRLRRSPQVFARFARLCCRSLLDTIGISWTPKTTWV
jgi:glycosyltransferase involved in cell wall biosynthesis